MKEVRDFALLEIHKEITERLFKIRKQESLTQAAIAEILGVSCQQYQKYENGKNRISAARYILLCRLLDHQSCK